MQANEDIIVGLDIGTTKICAVVGEVAGDTINIIGIGTHPSVGLRKGVVVNIESTVESIKKAVEEAELMAGCEISSVYAGIAGGHITGFNSRGIVAIKGPEITQGDVDRVIDAARAVAIPMDREVIHVLPQEYIVDDQAGIQNPVGMTGVRLEAKIHIVTGAVTSAHNIVKCANRAGLDVCDIVLESLASGEAVLTDEEKELGTALLDLGGRNHGSGHLLAKRTSSTPLSWPWGATTSPTTSPWACGPPLPRRKRSRKKFGSCLSQGIHGEETLEVPGHGGRDTAKTPEADFRRDSGAAHGRNLCLDQAGDLSGRDGADDLLRGGPHRRDVPARGGDGNRGIDLSRSHPAWDGPSGSPVWWTWWEIPCTPPAWAWSSTGRETGAAKKFRIRDGNIFNRIVAQMKKWFREVI